LIGAAVGISTVILVLAAVCVFFLRRKKQRRVRPADLRVPATPYSHSPDGGLHFEPDTHEARSVSFDVQPSHPEMTELGSDDITDYSIASGSTTSRIRRIPVPPLLDDPFADEARISDSSFTESNPFSDPEDMLPALITENVTANRLLSRSSSSLNGGGYASGEVTPKATQPSRLSAGSSLVGEGHASEQLTPMAIEPSRLSAGSSLVGEGHASEQLIPMAIEPSRLSAGSSLVGGDYAPSEVGAVSQILSPLVESAHVSR
jgi:hypothetical protein